MQVLSMRKDASPLEASPFHASPLKSSGCKSSQGSPSLSLEALRCALATTAARARCQRQGSSSLRCSSALPTPRLPPLLSSAPPPLLSSYAAGWQRRRLVRARYHKPCSTNNKPCSTNHCLNLATRCKQCLKASSVSRQAASQGYQPPISCTLRDQSPLKHTPWPSAPSSASYQPPSPPVFTHTHTHTPLEHLIRQS
jgi:hypothetical protein